MVLSYCAMSQPSPSSTLFSYTTLFRSQVHVGPAGDHLHAGVPGIRLLQTLGEDPRALEGAGLAVLEVLGGGDLERHGLRGVHVHARPALMPREHCVI